MMAPINFQDPIETLFTQIEDDVRYANAGMQPYMEVKYVNIAFLLILNTGSTPDACRDWQRRTPVNQTLDDFRREFTRDQQEKRIISSIARGSAYHTANVVEHYGPSSLPDDNSFVTVMVNLATATSAYGETLATFTKAVTTLTEKLNVKDIWAKTQEAEIKFLLGAQANAKPVVPNVQSTAYVRKSYRTKNDNYCWSHGYQVIGPYK
jgi:hypothetical protein